MNSRLNNSQNYIPWHKNSIICKIVEDLGDRNDICCEKYCKWSDTNSEMVGALVSLEYRILRKGSQPIRFENQKEYILVVGRYRR